jgi:hypothetical protein
MPATRSSCLLAKSRTFHAPHRSSNENHRSPDVVIVQEGREFARYLLGRAGAWPCVAVTHTRSVVRAHPRELRDLRLHGTPIKRGAAETSIQHDGGFTRASASDVQGISSNVDEFPGRRRGSKIATR